MNHKTQDTREKLADSRTNKLWLGGTMLVSAILVGPLPWLMRDVPITRIQAVGIVLGAVAIAAFVSFCALAALIGAPNRDLGDTNDGDMRR